MADMGIIRKWSDEELATQLRLSERATVPDTYLPLLAEALARLLEKSLDRKAA